MVNITEKMKEYEERQYMYDTTDVPSGLRRRCERPKVSSIVSLHQDNKLKVSVENKATGELYVSGEYAMTLTGSRIPSWTTQRVRKTFRGFVLGSTDTTQEARPVTGTIARARTWGRSRSRRRLRCQQEWRCEDSPRRLPIVSTRPSTMTVCIFS